jgi:hypothetical protein
MRADIHSVGTVGDVLAAARAQRYACSVSRWWPWVGDDGVRLQRRSSVASLRWSF